MPWLVCRLSLFCVCDAMYVCGARVCVCSVLVYHIHSTVCVQVVLGHRRAGCSAGPSHTRRHTHSLTHTQSHTHTHTHTEIHTSSTHTGGHAGYEIAPYIPTIEGLVALLVRGKAHHTPGLNTVQHHDWHHRCACVCVRGGGDAGCVWVSTCVCACVRACVHGYM